MRIGLDYRTVGTSPHSGISRQVHAMEQALESLPGTQVTRFTVAPLDDPLRQQAVCPPWGCPRTAMHQPHQRLRFEAGFLPRACASRASSCTSAPSTWACRYRRVRRACATRC